MAQECNHLLFNLLGSPTVIWQFGLQELLSTGKRLFEVDYTALRGFLAAANTQMENGERMFYMYATRGIFYLTDNGYMTMVAIEMFDCPDPNKPNDTVRQFFHGCARIMMLF